MIPTRRPWLVEQFWWRTKPVRRLYFQVASEDRPPITLFYDLVGDMWFEQEYQ